MEREREGPMAGFDAKAYKDDVLKPNARGEGLEQLREVVSEVQRDAASTAYARLDLHMLFAVSHPITAAGLRDWRAKIVPALNKAEQALPSAKFLKILFVALEAQGNDLEDPGFWGGLQAARQQLILGSLETGVDQLGVEYPLGVVTLDELSARLLTLGISGVTPGSVTSVARRRGLEVFDALDLPDDGMPGALVPIWKQVSKHPSFRSIFDLLLLHRPDDVEEITFLTRLSARDGAIGIADIDRARLKSEQSKDTDAMQDAQKFLGALGNHCRSESDLHAVALAAMIEHVSYHLARGKPLLAIRDDMVSRGLARSDSSRIVAALSASASMRGGSRLGIEGVRRLVADGRLTEAERTLAALGPAEQAEAEYAAVSALVSDLLARKATSLRRYHAALATRDVAAAASALREAIKIDDGDETLPQLLDELPPEAPRSLSVTGGDRGVELTWARHSDSGITYTILRARGRVPSAPTDGTVIAHARTEASFVDTDPPVAVPLGYAIFASKAGGSLSEAATAQLRYLPAPTSLTAEPDATGFRVSWNVPRSASGAIVSCTRPDGSTQESAVQTASSLDFTGLVTGSQYRVSVSAVYLDDAGRSLSEPVVISVIPRGTASQVRDLDIEPETGGDGTTLSARWTADRGFDVELWAFPRNTRLSAGTVVGAEYPRSLGGSRVATASGGSGRQGRARFTAPVEVVRIAPLTVVADGYLVGYAVLSGSAPAARDVTAEVFGPELRVSWTWPEGDSAIELRWTDGGVARTRAVTRARYRAEGGVKLAHAEDISDLSIATVVRVEDEEWRSPMAAVPLPARGTVTAARYEVQIKRALLGGKVTATFTATAETPGVLMPVVAVLKRGTIMPLGADDGQRLGAFMLDFTANPTCTHSIDAGKERSPLWITLFAVNDGDRLDPPPTSQMKA
jgi:hypothetical protein